MPHIILEVSKNVVSELDTAKFVRAAHEVLAEQLGQASRIKTRLIIAEEILVGDDGTDGAMVHVTLLLLEGRDTETKKAYSQAIYDVMKSHLEALPNCKLTLEVRDMDKSTYIL